MTDEAKAMSDVERVACALEAMYKACFGNPVGGGDGGTYVMGHPTKDQMNEAMEALRAYRASAAINAMSGWRDIETDPPKYDEVVKVKAGHMTFRAVLRNNIAMDDEGVSCDQWEAAIEGEHPPCWSDGACWELNVDGYGSLQPEEWRPVPPETDK